MPTSSLGKVSQALINTGFIIGLVLSVAGLTISGIYLFRFLSTTDHGIASTIQNDTTYTPGRTETLVNGRLVMGRLALLSCGILVGISFGSGFALFLLGIKETADVDLKSDLYKAKLARMSPGTLIIICSSLLVGICATRDTPFWYEHSIGTSGAVVESLETSDDLSNEDRKHSSPSSSPKPPPKQQTLTQP